MSTNKEMAAIKVREALLYVADTDEQKKSVLALYEEVFAIGDDTCLKQMACALTNGVLYGNWPWIIDMLGKPDFEKNIAEGHIMGPPEIKTAKQMRSWLQKKCPEGANYWGYSKEGECVLISSVRPRGSTAGVATATRNRALPAVKFTFTRGA